MTELTATMLTPEDADTTRPVRERRRSRHGQPTYSKRMIFLSERDLEPEKLITAPPAATTGRRPSRSVIVSLAYEALRKALQDKPSNVLV